MRNPARSSRVTRLLWAAAFSLSTTPVASAVTIDWAAVGDPGNACDSQSQGCFGAVAEAFRIGKYEVTNAQYAEFLNAVAGSDPFGLYHPSMQSNALGGIARSGDSPNLSYSTIEGREDLPVSFVTFYDALRFANWMHNGQGSGDTETGAYTLLGGTATPSNGSTVTRNAGAAIFVPSEDEWYKAAYYRAATATYLNYPAGRNGQTTCSTPTATANRANCDSVVGDLTAVGSYTGSASPYGAFDMGGNAWEWNETIIHSPNRGMRAGTYLSSASLLAGSVRSAGTAHGDYDFTGFRVASPIPEPGTGLLLMAGVLGLAVRRRRRA